MLELKTNKNVIFNVRLQYKFLSSGYIGKKL